MKGSPGTYRKSNYLIVCLQILPRAGLLQTRVKGDGKDLRTLKLSSHSCFVCLFEPSLLFFLLRPELGLQSLTTI